jgi:hypothetical protein
MRKMWIVFFVLLLPALARAQQTFTLTSAGYTGCTVTNPGTGCAIFPFGPNTNVGIQVLTTPSFSGHVSFVTSLDGVTWVAMNMFPPNSTTAVTGASGAGQWSGSAVANWFCACVDTLNSGSVGVVIRSAHQPRPLFAFAGSGGTPPVTKIVYLTTASSSPWTVPVDWNDANNSIEVIAGGGGGQEGAPATNQGAGGGGGGYAKITNVSLSSPVTFVVGLGGTGGSPGNNGGDTVFGGTSLALCIVGAQHGQGGQDFTGGAGGAATSACGSGITAHNGGAGGSNNNGSNDAGSGGGGGGGPLGDGGAGGLVSTLGSSAAGSGGGGNGGGNAGGSTGVTSLIGGVGGNNHAGAGGGVGGGTATGGPGGNGSNGGGGGGGNGGSGGNGGNGTEWDASHGSGGGGGAAGGVSASGTGGNYGGGGAGTAGIFSAPSGAPGIIVITYTTVGGELVSA